MTVVFQRIPKNRVGVLIGPDGTTKREIEERSGVRLTIDSEAGDIQMDDAKAFDPVVALKVRDVIRAIGRGFSPDHAFRLWADDMFLEVIDLVETAGKDEKHLERIRARIIGTGGKTRRSIEGATGVDMSIFGRTVGILGEIEGVKLAREAVDMLLDGAPHSAVYRFLEKRRRDLRLHELGLR